MGDNRADDGRFRPEHTDGDILAAVRAHEPAATSEVADELGMTRQGTDRRLRQLREAGRVNSKKIGASLVWFPATEETDETAAQAGETAPSTETGATHAPAETGHDEPDTAATDDALADAVGRVAAEWEDTDDRLAARKAAARAVLDYAREHGSVSKQEAKEEVYPEYPVADQNPRTWYRKNIRPVLNDAADYDQSARAYRLTVDT